MRFELTAGARMVSIAAIVAAAITFAGCATHARVAPMALCDPDAAARENIGPDLLGRSLAEAQVFSNKIYGADCFVCAEVYGSDPDTFRLHITSPIDDAIINTSAGITVRKSDGKILAREQWHSCHARVIHKAH